MASSSGSHEAMDGEATEVKSLTAKQIKALAKPEFAANPDKFYPVTTLKKFGYSRASCTKCGNHFWRHTDKKEVCGDSQCVGEYSFIGKGTGKGAKGQKITYAEAWEGFERSFKSAKIPHTAIKRYPVVARWRNDVDYVAAGIFCFQPFCVTGELEPPANPLICPQFCLRFNDLDNIGLTGRHYSGFIMIGIQVFNTPENFVYFKEECVEFNLNWLINELEIDPDDITLVEDVWAGGGNLGPSIEYFINGLELGNMVFMQYKTFPDGSREPLQVQVIDTGIGLERIPWLINGSVTSYVDVFAEAIGFLQTRLGIDLHASVWEKFGKYSCLLNVDEVDDVDKVWADIAAQIGVSKEELKKSVEEARDIYLLCDHTRTVLMAVEDGSLPSNVGGASNVRNVLRRVFALMSRRGWWDVLGMDGLMELFQCHRVALGKLSEGQYTFQEYKSFRPIIEIEYNRWISTDEESKIKLDRLIKKSGGKLTLDDWIMATTSFGLDADKVATLTGLAVPGNLFYEIATRQETVVKVTPAQLYDTVSMSPTQQLYYLEGQNIYDFDATVQQVLCNKQKGNVPNILILNRTAFYPLGGGQDCDRGVITLNGQTYQLADCMKVGKIIMHILDRPLEGDLSSYVGMPVHGAIDKARRFQLRNHHTATHIMHAACRKVLGPHVWQHGAKKSVEAAHLDITHFKSISSDEEIAIEMEANRIVQQSAQITKSFMPKDQAEKLYGFHLYQGGIAPGNELRVVNIEGVDVEACGGTHCDNTSEVGFIRILRSNRISDGVVRLYYVAGERALERHQEEAKVLSYLCESWRVEYKDLCSTGDRFFDGYKKLSSLVSKQSQSILNLQMKLLLSAADDLVVARTEESTATLFISCVPSYVEELKSKGKGVIFVGPTFVYGLVGAPEKFDATKLNAVLAEIAGPVAEGKKPASLIVKNKVSVKKGKKKEDVTGVSEFQSFSVPQGKADAVVEFLVSQGFKLSE